MCFITETWTKHGNEPEYQYIKANMDTAGCKILIQSTENRKGVGIAVIYKSHLHVKKLSFKEYTSFKALTVKLDITTISYLLLNHLQSTILNQATGNNADFLRKNFQTTFHPYLEAPKNIIILGDFNITLEQIREPRHHQHARNFGHA